MRLFLARLRGDSGALRMPAVRSWRLVASTGRREIITRGTRPATRLTVCRTSLSYPRKPAGKLAVRPAEGVPLRVRRRTWFALIAVILVVAAVWLGFSAFERALVGPRHDFVLADRPHVSDRVARPGQGAGDSGPRRPRPCRVASPPGRPYRGARQPLVPGRNPRLATVRAGVHGTPRAVREDRPPRPHVPPVGGEGQGQPECLRTPRCNTLSNRSRTRYLFASTAPPFHWILHPGSAAASLLTPSDVSGGHRQHGLPEGEETVRMWMPDNGRGDAVVATVAQQLGEGKRLIIYRADYSDAPTSQQASV
jgi:hypothetical protein